MGVLYFEENALEVPKLHVEGLQEWEKVAVKGFRNWLRFWNLEAVKDNSNAASLVDFGMNMPRPTEEQALGNLEKQAKVKLKVLQTVNLETVYREVLALDRYYLANYERREFRVKYWQFIERYVANKAELTPMHRYAWIAERMDFYTPKGLNKLLVIECLERADARMQMAYDRGEDIDLSVDITHLLVVKRQTQAA